VVNNRLFFAPSSNALATLSVFSINGKLLVHKQIPVIAGKQYLIRQFVLSSMNMPSSQVKIARISGAGIDVCEKVK
jgi:hypothetical protein